MIVVKIELWPFGNESKSRELGRAYIANDGTGDLERGNYTVAVCRKGSKRVPRPIDPQGPNATRGAKIFDYPRLSYSVWRLITRSLKTCFPEES